MTVRVAARRFEERGELGAMRVVAGRAHHRARGEVRGAHVDADAGGDAQPPTPLDAGLRREVVAVGALDGRLCQHGVTEESAAARPDARKRLARGRHAREAQVVIRPPGDPSDVAAAGLVEVTASGCASRIRATASSTPVGYATFL
jgi:hypothetical protein